MYKTYNSKAKNLSPLLERLVPFLVLATAFMWFWK